MAIGLITYQDTSRREDLIDVVTNISPSETPLLTRLPMGSPANNTLHQYTTDTFSTYNDNAQPEGSSFTVVDLTQPVRASNICQIFIEAVQVSETEIAVKGVVEPYSYQLQKNLVDHATDIELALMCGSTASGSSGTARRMTGVINGIVTNSTTKNSGTSLSSAEFQNIMQTIWASTSKVATEVYVGATLKRDITGFTTTLTRYQDASAGLMNLPVQVYESDFGVHKIFLHRNVPSAANNLTLVAINPDYWRKSYLRPTKTQPLPPDGDRRRAQIVTEMTLENRGEKASAVFFGYSS
jgi:hypothetical protein